MRLLLDTHVVLRWLSGRELSTAATTAISDPANDIWVSAASAWEIAIKRAVGKLVFDGSISEAQEESGFMALSVTVRHAQTAGALPLHHQDPFDRMLVAQALSEKLTVVTRDPIMASYEVDLMPA